MNETPAPEIAALARTISAVIFDVDGVMTNNQVWQGFPHKVKVRSYYDGQGISLLRAIGVRVAFVTNEKDDHAVAITEIVEKLNKLPSSQSESNPKGWPLVRLFTGMGGAKKVEAAKLFAGELGITASECAAMGDDLVDIPLLDFVSLRASPAQAEEVVKRRCQFVSRREGGNGAIRDFANFILEARGIDPTTLPFQ
ncbi:MAG: hypothetical protein EXS51_00350 [Candidatus Taylorbacteria bacterium]|nr:hypothetical protein [Candidatus Taylorbacteria bacterium]